MIGAMGGECRALREELTGLVDRVLGRGQGDEDGELWLKGWGDVEDVCRGFFCLEPMLREFKEIWVGFVWRLESVKNVSDE